MEPRFDAQGLVPAVVVDAATGQVLMLAWMDAEAYRRTRETGRTWFWSRSRRALWNKGETSGNVQEVVSMGLDCDGDALVVRVRPAGPACHRGTPTCWDVPTGGATAALDATLAARARERPAGSYTTRLLDDENLRLKKIGEETAELLHALLRGDDARCAEEAADLLYHVAVALRARGVDLADVMRVLERRGGS